MHKPIIGITCNTTLVEGTAQPGITRTFVNTDYIEAVALAGGVPLLLPSISDPALICEQVLAIDGLILSGGPDIDPLLYGEEPLAKLETVNKNRDHYELSVIQQAAKLKKPILGICRGIQFINVAFGGTLYQDLSYIDNCTIKHSQTTTQRNDLWHSVTVKSSSKLAQIIGQNELLVNSYHHQAVKTVAPDFTIVARAKDQVIEAIERPGEHFVLGIQWHPELLAKQNAFMLSLFQTLVTKAKQ